MRGQNSLDIEAVNLKSMIALANDDKVYTITNLFDEDGDETRDIDAAVTAVIRYDDDNWFTVRLSNFDGVLH